MSDILNNTSTLGESLPTTDRALTFRLTVRDNAAGGGGVDHSTVVHQVTTSAGPFAVTSQNTPTDWAGNTEQTVTWDVANTTAAPVSCPNVGIFYSDSGFPDFSVTTLVASTPNDGGETITAPNSSTTTGRVMVKCTSNIFFDINNADITITTDTFSVSGTVSGLLGSGLVLQNNAADNLGIVADGDFTFPTPLVDGSDYAVTVFTQPGEPDQACEVSDGSGTINGVDITNVDVTCVEAEPEIYFSDGFED
jgi:hypothetical protein